METDKSKIIISLGDLYKSAESYIRFADYKEKQKKGTPALVVDYKGEKIPIYNCYLAAVLSSKMFKDISLNEDPTITISDILTKIIDGYLEGKNYFMNNHFLPSKYRYSRNSSSYVKKIKHLYFNKNIEEFGGVTFGCRYVKTDTPYVTSLEKFFKWGFNTAYTKLIEVMFEEDNTLFFGENNTDIDTTPKLDILKNESQDSSTFEFTNNFDSINEEKVYNHFKSNLVDTKMIDEADLRLYLKASFENKQIPETLFSFKNVRNKQSVIKVFYNYYKNVAIKPHGKQKEYAGLLGDYFQGYKTDTVSTNFSKD
ncbi:hypothetical protein [Aquimarina celericrescens]|uniref:Uncharacterized protein n=1 Tax=Aquimarina celericrescens TaxID=1964542 RepID=A0ABW5ARJ7_9FLAO|nr:hypothetical protein [Aquimarina celericrescens]